MTAATSSRPRLQAPPGACDTHMHIYGPPARYPHAPTAPFVTPPHTVVDYRAMLARIGVERCVVVQPTGYGRDNRCTLDAVAEMGDTARAVVVVEPGAGEAELERLTGLGARGVRFHMLPGGVLPWTALPELAARVAPFGWHVQLQLDGRTLPDHEALLRDLPCGLVVDHVGRFFEPVAESHPGFRALLRLVERGAWVKLSAPYVSSRQGPPVYGDVGRLARRLVAAAPERMLWASNWPHPDIADPAAKPDDAVLLDTLLHWVDDDATRRRILADNPARLYGFPAP